MEDSRKFVRVEESRTIKLSSAGKPRCVNPDWSNASALQDLHFHASHINLFIRNDLVAQIVLVPDCELLFLGNVLTAALHAPYLNVSAWLGHIHEDLQQHSGSGCAESNSCQSLNLSSLLFSSAHNLAALPDPTSLLPLSVITELCIAALSP